MAKRKRLSKEKYRIDFYVRTKIQEILTANTNPSPKSLKEKTPYIIMELGEYNSVLKFLISDKQANIKRKGNKEYKKVTINDVEYPYNKEKPLVKNLKTKLEQVSKTPQYRRFKILEKASKGILIRNALKTTLLKTKPQ